MTELVYIENTSLGKVFYYNPGLQKGIVIKDNGDPFVMSMPSDYNFFERDSQAIVFGLNPKIFNDFFDAGRDGNKGKVEEIIERNFPKELSPHGYLDKWW